MKAIALIPRPKATKEAKRFIGGSGFFAKLVEGYAHCCAPIHRCTRNDVPVGDVSGYWTFSLEPEDPQYESHWRLEDGTRVVKDPLFTMCAEDGFNVIKSRLIAGAMLTSPDWTKRFWVACDASLHGYGSILAQMDDDGKLRPLHFDSGHFNETEQNRASVSHVSRVRPPCRYTNTDGLYWGQNSISSGSPTVDVWSKHGNRSRSTTLSSHE